MNKNFIWFEPYYCSYVASLSSYNKKGEFILFFFNIEDNMLIVEVLPNKQKKKKPFYHKQLAMFINGQNFLFIFDKNEIKFVSSIDVIYN